MDGVPVTTDVSPSSAGLIPGLSSVSESEQLLSENDIALSEKKDYVAARASLLVSGVHTLIHTTAIRK
jgi:hypothetical protein